jgi:hypothetical protein
MGRSLSSLGINGSHAKVEELLWWHLDLWKGISAAEVVEGMTHHVTSS